MKGKSIITLSILTVVVYVTWSLFPSNVVYSQETLQCGEPIPGEFVKNPESKFYQIQMSARESFEVLVDPAGDQLKVSLALSDPSDRIFKANIGVSETPTISSGELSATGLYKIRVSNANLAPSLGYSLVQPYTGPGFYTLVVNCTGIGGGNIGNDGQQPLSSPPSPLPITPSFVEIGTNYQITAYTGTFLATVVEIEDNGWVKVNTNGATSWLNLDQVLLVTPLQ